MKRLVALTLLSGTVLMAGCAEKKPLSPEEKWKGYCTSVGNAARSIALDRQNGISQKEAVDYANKVTDPTTKQLILATIERIYALPAAQLNADKDAVRDQLKTEAYTICLNTPHDPNKLPDYKPF